LTGTLREEPAAKTEMAGTKKAINVFLVPAVMFLGDLTAV
jgi:hypothetical protein